MFDLDGTLVETAPEITDALNDTLAQFGLPGVTQPQVDLWIGRGMRALLIQALAHLRSTAVENVRSSPDLPGIQGAFSAHLLQRCGTRSAPYPHVRRVLQSLRDTHVRVALVTNKEDRQARALLEAHALAQSFDVVVCGDTFPAKKPDPIGIRHCLATFNVTRARSLFVGDSSIDVAAARNAGVPVWVLPWGYNMGIPIAASQPDRVMTDLRDLIRT